jgi:hypothetical protein
VTPPPVESAGAPGEACKLITAILPDDGSDLKMLKELRREKGVIRADSMSCYASSSRLRAYGPGPPGDRRSLSE